MKKLFYLALAALLLLALTACEGKEVGSVTDIVKGVLEDNEMTSGSVYTSESTVAGEYLDEDMIASYYGSIVDAPDFSLIEEYCVYIDDKNPLLQTEIGIFKVIDSKNNSMIKEFIERRRDGILENARNYPSVDTEPFDNIVIETVGSYTYYVAVKENRSEIDGRLKEALS